MSLSDRHRALFGGLSPVFWVLCWGIFLNKAASFVIAFLALFLVQERGLDTAAAGRMVALYGVGGIVASLAGGALADRVGRRATMLASLSLGAVAVAALAMARPAWLLAPLILLAGVAGQMLPPALNAAVADLVPFADRPRAFGLTYWAANVGFGVGFSVAAVIGPRSLPALFLLDAATTAAFGLLVFRRVPETRPAGLERQPVLPGLGRALSDRVFVTFLGLTLLWLLVFTQWEMLLGLDVTAHGGGRAGYALLMVLNCVGAVVLQPLLGGWIRRGDPTRALAASALLAGAGYGLNALAGGLPVFAAGTVLWTFGEVLGLPVASALTASLAPPELRGRYQGVYATVMSTAFAVSPLLSGEAAARFGIRAVWLACPVLGTLVALGHLAAARPRRLRLAQRAVEAAPARPAA